MSLSILIPTVPERAIDFAALYRELLRQALPFGDEVEIIVDERPRPNQAGGLPIGAKRNDLLTKATKTHAVFFDDDDWPFEWYVADIMQALDSDPDCVGQVIEHTINGAPAPICIHSLQFPVWSPRPMPTEKWGLAYLRNVTHRNPVRLEFALKVGFPSIKYGEDEPYSNGVTKLCSTEAFIDRPSFIYRYSSKEPHDKKYGIR